MKNRLLIIGSGDLGQLIAHHAIYDNHYDVVGFVDDFVLEGTVINGIPVLGNLGNLDNLYKKKSFDFLMLGIGYKHMEIRKKLYNNLSKIYPFGKVIHSSSYIACNVLIGTGVFVLPGCTIDSGVKIGNNVLLNTAVVIAHDSEIEEHCFISPAVSIAGKTKVCKCCVIGINSTIIDNIIIASNIQIGGGAVVIDNLYKKGLYVGVPAKIK